MSATNTVRVESSTADVLKLLAATFSHSGTVLAELLQNARRARATSVSLNITDDAIEISDDGGGIIDFSVLLGVARSGWDSTIKSKEHPYGAGFLATLFTCERIEVESLGQRIAAQTEDLIAIRPVAIEAIATTDRTVIRLLGHRLGKTDQITNRLRRLCTGFPIPVAVNGELLGRKHSTTEGEWFETEIGLISREVLQGHGVANFYLQGLPISVSGLRLGCFNSRDSGPGIIHLNETFRGRMPDRDTLIDLEGSEERIQTVIRAIVTDFMRQERSRLGGEDWLRQYHRQAFALDMQEEINAIPFLPSKKACQLGDLPTLGSHEVTYRYDVPELVSRKELEEKGLFNPADYHEKALVEDVGARLYIYATDAYEANNIPIWHWAHKLVVNLAPDDIHVQPGCEIGSDRVDIYGEDTNIVFVETLALQRVERERDTDGDPVEGGESTPVGDPVDVKSYFDTQNYRLYVTPKASIRAAAFLVSSFMDGDERYDENALEQVVDRLRASREAATHNDPTTLLARIIEQGAAYNIPPLLHGKAFRVEVDEKGEITVVLA